MCKDTTSFEWFQSLLSSLESQSKKEATGGSEFLKIHTYLTQKLDADTAQNIVLNSVGTNLDPLTELQSRTNFGRPDFKRFLSSMRDAINRGSYMPGMEGALKTNVGVYFCGPSVAARDIRQACKAASTPEIDFSFWKEQLVTPPDVFHCFGSCSNLSFLTTVSEEQIPELFVYNSSLLFP